MKKRQKKKKSSKDNSDEGSDIEKAPPLVTMLEPSTSTVAAAETTENVGDSLWKKGIHKS